MIITRQRLVPILLALTCFCGFDNLYAVPTAKKKVSPEVARLEWKVLEKENQYRASGSDKDKDTLLFAYENLANKICMPRFFKSFDFAGKPEEPHCLDVLKKIQKLSTESTAQLCIEEGFQSEKCIESYNAQVSLPLESVDDSTTYKALSLIPEKLTVTLERSERAYKKKRDMSSLKEMMALYRPAIKRECSDVTLRFMKESSLPISRTTYFNNENVKKSDEEKMESLVADLDKKKSNSPWGAQGRDKKKDNRHKLVRVRVLPNVCNLLLERLLEVHPLSSLAICERDGGYSHHCVRSIRQERNFLKKLKTSKQPTTKNKNTSKKKSAPPKKKNFSVF